MLSIKSLVEELNYFLSTSISGLRGFRALPDIGFLRQFWRWVRKFSEKINVKSSRIPRKLIALDETCVKVSGLDYWIYA
jgi:hypothetical protein